MLKYTTDMGSSSLPSHLVDTLATLPTERLQAATQLIKASSQGDLASVKGLLEKGADAWVQVSKINLSLFN